MVIKRYAVIKKEIVENVIELDDSLAASWFDNDPDRELEEVKDAKFVAGITPVMGAVRDKSKTKEGRFIKPTLPVDRLAELRQKIETDTDTPEEFREYVKLRDGL